MSEPFEKAVVLLTGGTGFIGSHCLTRLLEQGCIVHAVNREGAGPFADRVQWHSADLRKPVDAAGVVGRVRPTHLLHSAWITVPGRFWSDPENLRWLEAGIALLRGFGEAGGRHFVAVGTCAEYDWQGSEFKEDSTPVKPSTLYGRSKAELAAAASAFAEQYGFTAAWGRVFQPFGVGDAPQRLIPSVIDALLARRPIALGHGWLERDFIFAPDLADLFVRLLCGKYDGVFNVATGRATTLRTVVELIADRVGGRELLRFGEFSSSMNEPLRLVADMTKVREELGWMAPTPLEVGIDELLRRAQGKAVGDFNKNEDVQRGIG